MHTGCEFHSSPHELFQFLLQSQRHLAFCSWYEECSAAFLPCEHLRLLEPCVVRTPEETEEGQSSGFEERDPKLRLCRSNCCRLFQQSLASSLELQEPKLPKLRLWMLKCFSALGFQERGTPKPRLCRVDPKLRLCRSK